MPDAFVVEGPKAGGHLGFKQDALLDTNNKLENLVSQVLEVTSNIKKMFNKDIPVIAAGGIYTGKDIYNIIEQGVPAVQLGTRFVATEECDASLEFKNAFIKARKEDIQIIKSPVGMPGRTIFNNFLHEANEGKKQPEICKYNCIKSCNPKTTSYCIAKALLEAYSGNLAEGFAFTGTSAERISEISTVKSVFENLKLEYKQAQQDN